jgi:hypothetical protein
MEKLMKLLEEQPLEVVKKQIKGRVPLSLSHVSPFFHIFSQNMANNKPQISFSSKRKKWIYLEIYTKWYI